jgi:hypothetical protein
MPSHKSQHFVPRCHLKPFTVEGQGAAINIYNIDSHRGIRNAPVRGQCAGDYFYGEDLNLETWLQGIETRYGELISRIKVPRYKLDLTDTEFIKRFVFLQYSRTETAARRRSVGTADIHDTVFSNSENPEKIDLSTRSVIQECMETCASLLPIVSDLKVCLVRNNTHRSFLTSDDPSVLTNRWYIQKAKRDDFGLGSAGALLMLPLTPKIVVLCYDGAVYSIQNIEGWGFVNAIPDVQAINEHQFLKCSSNVYFSQWSELQNIEDDFLRCEVGRLTAWHHVIAAELESSNAWEESYKVIPRCNVSFPGRYMLNMRAAHPMPQRWPSIIRYRAKPTIYTNGSAVGFIRERWIGEASSAFSAPYRKVSG